MTQSQIIWTVLPNGFSDAAATRLKLSLFLSPRLRFDTPEEEDGGTLASFPDFQDWPSRLADLKLDLIVDDDAAGARRATITTKPPLDVELWKAVLPAQTPVVSHTSGFETSEPISSYPSSSIANSIADGYSRLGHRSPYLPAQDRELAESFAPIHRAILPEGSDRRSERLRSIDALTTAALEADHELVSATLLRREPGITFDQKLVAAREIAGRLARARWKNRKGAVPLIRDGDDPVSAFAQFAAFNRRRLRPDGARRRRGPPPGEPVKDFHEILSTFGEYPELLRRLGLVIDLEIEAAAILEARRGSVRRLRVAPSLPGISAAISFKTPGTTYLLSRSGDDALPQPTFCAAPRGAERPPDPATEDKFEIVGGFLNLSQLRPDDTAGQTPLFSLLQVDVDGAGIKLLNALDTIVAGGARPDNLQAAGAPTLRTSGLSLVRAKFAHSLMAGVNRGEELEASLMAGGNPVLFAEDLVRGYRVDVRKFPAGFDFSSHQAVAAEPWLSLHKREGMFRIPRPGGTDLERFTSDEGFVQPAMAQDVEEDDDAGDGVHPLYVSESLFHWQGWSLSAPPPTTPLQPEPFEAKPISLTGSHPVVAFEATKHSLPRLRFGHYYQVRARTVDLAGNSLSRAQADKALEAIAAARRKLPVFPPAPKDFFFLRFEPIPPPALVLRAELTEGEAPDLLVIRSDEGLSASAYAATLGDPKYKGIAERHVVPPKAAQRMTEMHGLYEAAFGEGGDPARFYAICSKESGSLSDTHVVDAATGELEPLPDFIDPQTGERVPFGLKFVRVQAEAGEYAIHCEERLRLPYLPDPLARGAALFGLPGTEGEKGEGISGDYNDQTGELSYGGQQLLPNSARADLGSVTKIGFGQDWPDCLPFRLLLAEGPDVAPRLLPSWSSAPRVLTVQLPPGETASLWLSSYPAKSDIDLFGLYAWWNKHVGSPVEQREFLNTAQHGALAMLSPAHKVLLVHAVQRPVRLARPSPSSTLGIKRFAGDTVAYFGGTFQIHGPSTAKLDLWAHWTEPGEAGGPAASAHVHVLELPIDPKGVSPEEAAFADEKPIATYARGRAESFAFLPPPNAETAHKYHARQVFDDTKHRKVTYTLTATTRFPEYFPLSITDDVGNITRSISFEEVILSSARPAAPEIAGVVPILSKEEVFDVSDLVESRRRGGLRVFLGPTWYSSGDGEKLAVIGPVRWGVDPVHAFLAGEGGAQVAPEAPAVTLGGASVHPVTVDYCKQRRTYFADIIFDAKAAYFPFVRLALARYQPNALDGLHLSASVDAGVHQLTATRSVQLSYPLAAPTDPGRRINISVVGKRPSAAGHLPATRGYRVEVVIEERLRRPDDPDADLRWSAATSGQVLGDAPPQAGALWSGHLFMPHADAMERRIVIREFELFPPNADLPGQAWIGQSESITGFSRRLVYADTILLF